MYCIKLLDTIIKEEMLHHLIVVPKRDTPGWTFDQICEIFYEMFGLP